MDTALHTPHEICEWNTAVPAPSGTYCAGPRSVVVLIAGEGRMLAAGFRSASAEATGNPRNMLRPDQATELLLNKVRHS